MINHPTIDLSSVPSAVIDAFPDEWARANVSQANSKIREANRLSQDAYDLIIGNARCASASVIAKRCRTARFARFDALKAEIRCRSHICIVINKAQERGMDTGGFMASNTAALIKMKGILATKAKRLSV